MSLLLLLKVVGILCSHPLVLNPRPTKETLVLVTPLGFLPLLSMPAGSYQRVFFCNRIYFRGKSPKIVPLHKIPRFTFASVIHKFIKSFIHHFMETKLFTQLSATEKQTWLENYQTWLTKLPAIEKATNITSTLRADIEEGLTLLAAFPYCRSFVAEAFRFKDYKYRLKLIRRYADQVTADAKEIMQKTIDLSDPSLLVPHVGRPTKEEAAARAMKAEQERIEKEANEETLFGKKADIPTVEPAAPATVSGSLIGDARLHLDQLKWLLSPTLQEAVDGVHELRTKAAEAATIAKQMATDGKPEKDIEPFAQEAAEKTEAYENIYARVDDEMARVYVRLKEDKTFIASIQAKKIDPTELRTMLRPYWDKLEDGDKEKVKNEVIDFIKANDPEQAAIREKEEKKKKAAADIIKYLQRKDKVNTEKRIAGMKAKFEELKALIGEEEANIYLPVLNVAIEDYEKNVKPKKEADKAEKEAKKAAKTAEKKDKK